MAAPDDSNVVLVLGDLELDPFGSARDVANAIDAVATADESDAEFPNSPCRALVIRGSVVLPILV
jgi:hypothetical protein